MCPRVCGGRLRLSFYINDEVFSPFLELVSVVFGEFRGEAGEVSLVLSAGSGLGCIAMCSEQLLSHRHQPWTSHCFRPAERVLPALSAEVLILHPLLSQVTCAFLDAFVSFCFFFYFINSGFPTDSIWEAASFMLELRRHWAFLFFFIQVLSVDTSLFAELVYFI